MRLRYSLSFSFYRYLAVANILLGITVSATHSNTTSSLSSPGVVIPAGLPIVVEYIEDLAPSQCAVGDTVIVSVAQDILIDGCPVILQGQPVIARIVTSKKPGALGEEGRLRLEYAQVQAVDGTSVLLRGDRSLRGANRLAESLGITLYFCCLGLFIPGTDVKIHAGSQAVAVVAARAEITCPPDIGNEE